MSPRREIATNATNNTFTWEIHFGAIEVISTLVSSSQLQYMAVIPSRSLATHTLIFIFRLLFIMHQIALLLVLLFKC